MYKPYGMEKHSSRWSHFLWQKNQNKVILHKKLLKSSRNTPETFEKGGKFLSEVFSNTSKNVFITTS